MKKIAYLLIFFIFIGCGYNPIYSKKDHYKVSIESYFLEGDKDINRKLISLLRLKKSESQEISSYDLVLNSKKIIQTIAKDNLGNTSIYKTTISVDFTLKNLNTGSKVFRSKNFNADFSYNNVTNKFDLSQYQKTIEVNLLTRIAEEITIFINS
tara:strand:+ start:3812 stop:4273 length:462 start_codon:yes stop_codon:yes gene_type:complete